MKRNIDFDQKMLLLKVNNSVHIKNYLILFITYIILEFIYSITSMDPKRVQVSVIVEKSSKK